MSARSESLKEFWASWYEFADDWRSVTYPPNQSIVGYWCSGYSGNASTVCAWVVAKNEKEAKRAIRADWPGQHKRWRFFIEKTIQDGDRFKFDDWMIERFNALRGAP